MSRLLVFLLLGATFGAGVAACSGRGTVIESRRETPPGELPDSGGPHERGTGGDGGSERAPGDGGSERAPGDGGSESGVAVESDLLTPKSGSRIAVTGVVAGDQILGVDDVADRQHATSCAVQTGADGIPRCLPLAQNIVFRDSACTQPVFHVQGGSVCPTEPPPAYTAYASAEACPSTKFNVVRVGTLISDRAVQTNYELNADTGACSEAIHGFDSYYSTTPSPASDWVAFERKLVKVTDGLGVEVWLGQDGSRIPGSYRLLPSEVACEPLGPSGSPSSTAANHCIPVNHAFEAYYADSACTEVVALADSSCDPPTISERIEDLGNCAPQRYFELGRQVPPDSLYWRTGQLMGQTPDQSPCQRVPSVTASSSANATYVVGAEIDVGRYPVMQLVAEGAGRIRPFYWESGGRRLQLTVGGDAFDSQLGVSCFPMDFGDGKMRCAPSMASFVIQNAFYGDAACTVRVYLDQRSSSCPDEEPPPAWVSEQVLGSGNAPGCGTGTSSIGPVHPLTGEHRGNVYGLDEITRKCAPYALPTDQSTHLYDVGDPVDPRTAFAEVTPTEL